MKRHLIAALALACVINFDVHAGKPAEPATASAAGAKSTLAEQNRVNHEFLERYANGPTGNPGAWYGSKGSVTQIGRSEDSYQVTTTVIRRDGQLGRMLRTYRLDKARAAVIYTVGAKSFLVRFSRKGANSYVMRTLPGLDATPESLSKFEYTFVFDGSRIEQLSAATNDSTTVEWLDVSDALARQAERVRNVLAEIEAKRQADYNAQLAAAQAQYVNPLDFNVAMANENARLQQEMEYEQEEAERQARAAQWKADKQRLEQELEESLDRFRESTANREAVSRQLNAQQQSYPGAHSAAEVESARQATERQNEIARQYEARRQAEAQAQAQAQATAPPSATATAGSTARNTPSGGLMGFPGPTCEFARANAQRWVGSGGSFEVANEVIEASGSCLVQIKLDSVRRGSGTASGQ